MTAPTPDRGAGPGQLDLPGPTRAIPLPRHPQRLPGPAATGDGDSRVIFELAGSSPESASSLLAAAQRLTGLALWSWDVRTGALSWSAEMFALLGLPLDESVTIAQWQQWLHPQDRDALAEQDAQAVAAGVPWQSVFRVLPPDGAVRHLHAWCEPVCDGQGAVVAVFGVTLDVTGSVQDANQLRESRKLLDAAVRLTGLAFWTMSLDGTRVWASPALNALAGAPVGGAGPTPVEFLGLLDDAQGARVKDAFEDVVRTGRPAEVTVQLQGMDGVRRHVRAWMEVQQGERGESVAVSGASLDVSKEQQVQEALRAGQEEFRLAFDEAPTGMAIIDVDPDLDADPASHPDGHPDSGVHVHRVNRALLDLVGADPQQSGVMTAALVVEDDRAKLWQLLRRSLDPAAGVHAQELRLRHRDGHLIHAWAQSASSGSQPGGRTRLLLHVMDLTALRESQAELQALVLTDPVTGLANRTALERRVRDLLPQVTTARGLGLMLLDLDRFKVVNDSLGHVAGNALLVEVGRRLDGAVPPSALVVRLGGDEFAVLVQPCPGAEQLADLAGLVRARLARPYQLPGDLVVTVTASIGVTWSGDPEHGMDVLYREADLALYEAKDSGRDAVAAFDDTLRARADTRIVAERNLRAALAANGVRLFLQPITDLHDGARVVSGEALARLEHPTLGLLMPNDFIPVAEDTGLVVEIDCRITELAIAALARPGGGPVPRIAVNVSPRTLDHPDYLRRLERALSVHGVHPSRLIVEVTESSLLDATGQRAAELGKIQALGIDVGIDDFGTGYSALAYLDRFRLDFLKIDRSFVSRLGTSTQSDAVVAAIISLAHAHAMSVTAEGVETQEQADLLTEMGCDRGQGWLFGRPAPI